MYMIDNVELYRRIKQSWERKGFKNARQFCQSTCIGHSITEDKPNLLISEQTITNIKKGKNPDLQTLINICDSLDVDIDYVICKQELPTKIKSDIKAETGLSEEAIDKLVNCDELYDLVPREIDESTEHYNKSVNEEKNKVISLISKMISHTDFIPIIYKILNVSENWKVKRALSSTVMGNLTDDSVKALRMNPHRTPNENELLLSLYDVETLITDYVEQIIQKE